MLIKGKYTTAKVMIDNIEEECADQIRKFTNYEAFTNDISIMPDTHVGEKCVIGFTMPMSDKIIPNVIGVDGCCGMLSFNIGSFLFTKGQLIDLDSKIRAAIPFGQNVHDESLIDMKDFSWDNLNILANEFIIAYKNKFGKELSHPKYDYDWFKEKCKSIKGSEKRFSSSLGTLGGGNHFIEIGKSQNTDNIWITIHSGSRNLGGRICKYWQDQTVDHLRQEKLDKLKIRILQIREQFKDERTRIGEEIAKEKIKLEIGTKIMSKGYEWLEGDNLIEYLFDMLFVQVYAQKNRRLISRQIIDIFNVSVIDSIETVHNFIDFNDFIIRKGAIRSYKNERMIIPFNMRDGLLICEGKSNSEWNYSAPHGAGRVMSRTKAKQKINLKDFKKQMKGIFSTSICENTIDEAPDAYKDAKFIEEAIGPTAIILDRIKPIHNMKDIEVIDYGKKV